MDELKYRSMKTVGDVINAPVAGVVLGLEVQNDCFGQ
jgi:hypothetical protein